MFACFLLKFALFLLAESSDASQIDLVFLGSFSFKVKAESYPAYFVSFPLK